MQEIVRRFNNLGKNLESEIQEKILEERHENVVINNNNSVKEETVSFEQKLENLVEESKALSLVSNTLSSTSNELQIEYEDVELFGIPNVPLVEMKEDGVIKPSSISVSEEENSIFFTGVIDVELLPSVIENSKDIFLSGSLLDRNPLCTVYYGQVRPLGLIHKNSRTIDYGRPWDDSNQTWVIRVHPKYLKGKEYDVHEVMIPQNRKGPQKILQRYSVHFLSGRARVRKGPRYQVITWSLQLRWHQTGEPEVNDRFGLHQSVVRGEGSPWAANTLK
jgi:hypothetical protein